MFCTFCAIISPEWTHSCQGSGDWRVVATSGHLTLAALCQATGLVPIPWTMSSFGRTGRTKRMNPTALRASCIGGFTRLELVG